VNDLNIRERRSGDVTVLDMNGRMRIGDDAIALRNSIRVLVKEGKTKILLNLAGVTHIDSCGLAELISGHMSLNKSGGVIKLVHLTKRVRELMTITKLVTVFDIYDDEPEAVASFQG
jgi:anti-sigma B factor antagonist